ncbi:hypothetical protein BC938DRAFT_471651 [Jimgerdemannia flammicorona]|uniref:AAA+ ATPase domain-containing protein n=1 Tax=Jimgerdemannia flammicorona TaxID=994334 RepID=A0A433R005_9FUNG|nr:hypothetical protein BC938DRAFT_471651 [Jimgerdemannia flammicorona]
MIFDRAKISAPSVIMIKDLDLLCRDSTVDSTVKSSVIKILLKEIDGLGSNEKVFLIGISRNRSKLPEILRKPELFQYDLPVPVPSRPQRELILKAYLSVLNLHPMPSAQDVVSHYANEIGQKTSGYVARDLVQLCRSAVLHAMRRRDIDHKDANEMDVLSRGMAGLRVAEAVKADANSMPIEWRDFEYALSISKPSQQVEFESTLPKRSWEDIGGYAAIKKRMKQVVILPLLKPEAYRNLGISPPSGLLLYGPSGCGKTILVQALASQSGMNVIAIKGPEIFSKYLGETENTLRRLFAMARQIAPCIIFFDEMDSIGMKRGEDRFTLHITTDFYFGADGFYPLLERNAGDGTSGINERVLSTLLNEMDGVEGRRGVFVIGCTNRPNQIDDAILRPGRLDQLLYVGLPDETDRKSILTAITRRVPVASDVSINLLAQQTEQFTGSDLETLEAAIRALRENIDMPLVHWRHIEPVLAKMAAAVRSSAGEDRLELFRKFQERAKG